MAGPRRDKANAWFALDWVIYEAGIRLEGIDRNEPERELTYALEMLRESGRFDVKQIAAIKDVVRAVIAAIRTPKGAPKLIDVYADDDRG